MSEQNTEWHKIITIPGKDAFLDVYDRLDPDPKRSRLVFFCTNYNEKSSVSAYHYISPDVFKVIAGDILRDVFPKAHPEGFREFKGSMVDGSIQSRVLTIRCDPSRRYPYLVRIENGPGKETGKGAVIPDGDPEVAVQIWLSRMDMHRLCQEVVDYVRDWTLYYRISSVFRRQARES